MGEIHPPNKPASRGRGGAGAPRRAPWLCNCSPRGLPLSRTAWTSPDGHTSGRCAMRSTPPVSTPRPGPRRRSRQRSTPTCERLAGHGRIGSNDRARSWLHGCAACPHVPTTPARFTAAQPPAWSRAVRGSWSRQRHVRCKWHCLPSSPRQSPSRPQQGWPTPAGYSPSSDSAARPQHGQPERSRYRCARVRQRSHRRSASAPRVGARMRRGVGSCRLTGRMFATGAGTPRQVRRRDAASMRAGLAWGGVPTRRPRPATAPVSPRGRRPDAPARGRLRSERHRRCHRGGGPTC